MRGTWLLVGGPVDPSSTAIQLAVYGGDCGATPRTQSISYTPTAIEIAVDLVAARPGPGELETCAVPFLSIALIEPVGNRRLVDANR